jgi:hypothetical protein
MAQIFNPFTGQLDFTGSTSVAPAATNYVQTFTTATFGASGGNYILTITAATHGLGTSPGVEVFELVGSDYVVIISSILVNTSGDVTISVNQTPDARFNGKVVIY